MIPLQFLVKPDFMEDVILFNDGNPFYAFEQRFATPKKKLMVPSICLNNRANAENARQCVDSTETASESRILSCRLGSSVIS